MWRLVHERLQGRLILPDREGPKTPGHEFRVEGIPDQSGRPSELSCNPDRGEEKRWDTPAPLERKKREEHEVLAPRVGCSAGSPRSRGHHQNPIVTLRGNVVQSEASLPESLMVAVGRRDSPASGSVLFDLGALGIPPKQVIQARGGRVEAFSIVAHSAPSHSSLVFGPDGW